MQTWQILCEFMIYEEGTLECFWTDQSYMLDCEDHIDLITMYVYRRPVNSREINV